MSARNATILLAAIGVVRGSSFLFSKLLLEALEPFTLLAWRFLLAFVILGPLFNKQLRAMDKRTLLHGIVLGLLFAGVMGLEMWALLFTASSTVSFLEHTAIVLVPIFEALVFRTLPTRKAMLCTLVVMIGVGLLTLHGGFSSFSIGEALGLCGATIYAIAIIATARFARTDDTICLGVLQIGVLGLLSLGAALAFEQPSVPADGTQWLFLAIQVLLCTVFGFTFQPVAQRYLSAQTAGMLCATNPLTAAVLGILVLGEPHTLPVFVGMALIIGVIVVISAAPKDAE